VFDPAVVDPAVDFLADLAGTGSALELGVGTGRIALPLSRRGVRVHGIELSPAMVAQLQAQEGASVIGVTIGDFATAKVGGAFTLSAPYRYVWPSELDLMARISGMTLRERWSDWHRNPFTSESRKRISVWEKDASVNEPAMSPAPTDRRTVQ
jgi:SAM-dependent methyltransferase